MASSRTLKALTASRALTASLLGLTILASAAAPAAAQDNGRDREHRRYDRDDHRRPGPPPDFRHRPGPPPHYHRPPPPPPVVYYRGRPRQHDDGALVSGITGLLAGTVIGALITSGSQSAPPPPQVVYVQPSVPVPPQQASIMVPNGGMQNVVLNFSPTALPGQPYCRTYSTTVLIDGYPSPVSGVACQNPDGTWHLQS